VSALRWVFRIEQYMVGLGCAVGVVRLWPRKGEPRSRNVILLLLVLAWLGLLVLSSTPGFPITPWIFAGLFGVFAVTLWVFVWPRRRR